MRLISILFFSFMLSTSLAVAIADNNSPSLEEVIKQQNEACQALVRDKGPDAFDQLFDWFKQGKYWSAQKCIIENLIEIDKEKTLNALIELYKTTKNSSIEKRSALALTRFKDNRASEALYETFTNPGSKNKFLAAFALATWEDQRVVPFLLSCLNPDSNTQKRAAIALSRYKDPNYCQQIYEIWIQDSSPSSEIDLGRIIIFEDCNNKYTRMDIGTDSRFSDQTCSLLQGFVDNATKAMTTPDFNMQFQKPINLMSYLEEQSSGNPDEDKIRNNFVLLVLNWAEHVNNAYNLSSSENNKEDRIKIVQFRRMEEALLLACPTLKFPDISY